MAIIKYDHTMRQEWDANKGGWAELKFEADPSRITVIKDEYGQNVMRAACLAHDYSPWGASGTLIGDTTTMPIAGDEVTLGFKIKIPRADNSNQFYGLLWEYHNSGNVKSTIAPLAIISNNIKHRWDGTQFVSYTPSTNYDNLLLRFCPGLVPSSGGNQQYWYSNVQIPGLSPLPYDVWIKIMMHIIFSEDKSKGLLELWASTDDKPVFDPVKPLMKIVGYPTLVWTTDSNGNIVHDHVYEQFGTYSGVVQAQFADNLVSLNSGVLADEFANVAAFLNAGTVVPPQPVDHFANARNYMAKFQTGSPNIYGAIDETLKGLGH